MLSDQARLALYDIKDNGDLAQSFVEGLSFEAFVADRRTFYAVTRALEIVSEAARRLPESIRERHPELPWRAIMGAGNVYRHDYDNVAEEFVWRTLRESLPALTSAVAEEIAMRRSCSDSSSGTFAFACEYFVKSFAQMLMTETMMSAMAGEGGRPPPDKRKQGFALALQVV